MCGHAFKLPLSLSEDASQSSICSIRWLISLSPRNQFAACDLCSDCKDEPWKYFVCRNTLWGVIANFLHPNRMLRKASVVSVLDNYTYNATAQITLFMFYPKNVNFSSEIQDERYCRCLSVSLAKISHRVCFPLQLSTKIYCAKTYRDVILDFLSFYPFFSFYPPVRSVLKWSLIKCSLTCDRQVRISTLLQMILLFYLLCVRMWS